MVNVDVLLHIKCIYAKYLEGIKLGAIKSPISEAGGYYCFRLICYKSLQSPHLTSIDAIVS